MVSIKTGEKRVRAEAGEAEVEAENDFKEKKLLFLYSCFN